MASSFPRNNRKSPIKRRSSESAPPRREVSEDPSSTSRSAIFLGGDAPSRPHPRKRLPSSPKKSGVSAIESDAPVGGLGLGADDGEVVLDETAGSSILASAEEWTEDASDDSTVGLGAEGTRDTEKGVNHRTGAVKNKRRNIKLTGRDIQIIRLLGKYKFGYRTQIEAFCDRNDLSRRLTQLANHGLLRNEKITQNQAVWTPTVAGIELANLEVPALTHGRITPTTVAHTVGLLNLGIGFEKGDPSNNLLKDSSWPYDWRRELNRDQVSYRLETGETVVTERMIQQSFNRQKSLYGEEELQSRWLDAMAWVPPKGAEDGRMFGPEAEEGNEWMFVAQPPFKAHIPDMVLVRPRNADGSSRHVGIELELSSKPIPEWRRILTAFKGNDMFATVAYFTHKRTIKDGVTEVNRKHVGMEPGKELLMMKYVPRVENLPFWG